MEIGEATPRNLRDRMNYYSSSVYTDELQPLQSARALCRFYATHFVKGFVRHPLSPASARGVIFTRGETPFWEKIIAFPARRLRASKLEPSSAEKGIDSKGVGDGGRADFAGSP